jgi:hypothetical protein
MVRFLLETIVLLIKSPVSCSPASKPSTSATRPRPVVHQRSGVLCVAQPPLLEIFRFEDERHSVVHLGHKLVRLRDDPRARPQFVAGLTRLASRAASP